VASDRVTAAVAELYGADPEEFTARRKELADEARAAGDRDASKEITALRKPTRAAWVVNRLARADPGAPERLAALADGLRAAAEAGDGRKLRELSARRGSLIDGLAGQALDAAGVADPPAGLREEVVATLTAALGDPETAERLAAGTLTRASQWAGFSAFAPPGFGTAPETADEDTAEPAASAAPSPAPAPRKRAALRLVPPARDRAADGGTTAQRRTGKAAPSGAREDDDGAARRQQAIDDAERIAATAASAAAAAVTEEDRLEATVRDLEERLTKARAELASARMRARRAEAAERKARQTLDHLRPQ
jgi:hypothetical protein